MPPPDSLQALISTHPLFTRSRLVSLYSDFRPLTRTNPDGYTANVSAWLTLFTDAAKQGLLPSSSSTSPDTLVLTVNPNLISSLARDDVGRPLAIGAVISDSLGSKSLISLNIFSNQPSSIYATPNVLVSLGSWALSKLPIIGTFTSASGSPPAPFISEDTVNKQTTKYVLLPNLELAARSILSQFQSQHSGLVSSLFTYEAFLTSFPNPLLQTQKTTPLSPTDAEIILTYLTRDFPSLSRSPDGKFIKFRPPTSTSPPEAITQTDITIATLKSTISQTHASLTKLSTHASSLDIKIKSHLASNNKPLALATLKTKKLVDQNISHRASSLTQLESLLFQIEAAADNVSLFSLLDSGAGALRDLTKQTGGVEKVEEVLERVKEAGEDAEEIQRVVQSGIGGEVDEGEVEDELEEMLREEERRERERGVREYERRARDAEEKARRDAEELARRLGGLEVVGGVVGREKEKEREENENEVVS